MFSISNLINYIAAHPQENPRVICQYEYRRNSVEFGMVFQGVLFVSNCQKGLESPGFPFSSCWKSSPFWLLLGCRDFWQPPSLSSPRAAAARRGLEGCSQGCWLFQSSKKKKGRRCRSIFNNPHTICWTSILNQCLITTP